MNKKCLNYLFINTIFIVLILIYIITFPIVFFNLEFNSLLIPLLSGIFITGLILFMLKISVGNKATKFLLYFFQFWILLFLLINIKNLFLYSGVEHEKYLISNILIYFFHLILFLCIGYNLYKIHNKSFLKFKFIGIFAIIYLLFPGIEYGYVPNDYFSLNNKYENIFLDENYKMISRNHFIDNADFYKEKLNNNPSYLQLLKRDLYEYEFNSTTDYVKSYLSVPFVYNSADLLKLTRVEFYYSYKHNQYPTVILPKIPKYFYSNFIIKNSFDNFTLPVTDNRFKEYIRQLEIIKK